MLQTRSTGGWRFFSFSAVIKRFLPAGVDRGRLARGCLLVILLVSGHPGWAARQADIRNTKHNFSTSSAADVRATGTLGKTAAGVPVAVGGDEVCVFCHAPHAAATQDAAGSALGAPLWNRRVKATTYTGYTSTSLDAGASSADVYTGQPGASSKLCLSCHDGTLAIGNVGVTAGQYDSVSGAGADDIGVQIPFRGTLGADASGFGGTIPEGTYGSDTGFTRRLGTNLSNDHPISVSFTQTLATADGELRAPSADGLQSISGLSLTAPANGYSRQSFNASVARRSGGARPMLPLVPALDGGSGAATGNGQVACATCHDPHLSDQADTAGGKFLRANRFQKTAPNKTDTLAEFDASRDIICLGCHSKAFDVWANSAHANNDVAQPQYKAAAAVVREFPAGIRVWQASCLNCHDPHTNPYARRLLREGSDQGYSSFTVAGATAVVKKGVPLKGAALEETCFMCHRPRLDPQQSLDLSSQTVPDVWTDFNVTGSYRMPIASVDQYIQTESHSIGNVSGGNVATALAGKDFVESPETLGSTLGDFSKPTSSRHAECTDCHNPHRVARGNHSEPLNNPDGDVRGTDKGNRISNALKGGFGVEPRYDSSNPAFGKLPVGFDLKCGSGRGSRYAGCNGDLQYEYQICMKCHSNYAYKDTDGPTSAQYNYAGRPTIGGVGLTPAGDVRFRGQTTVNVWPTDARYTNQAMEFFPPVNHRGELNGSGSEPVGIDHRSWHPVMGATGRTSAERSGASNFHTPWQTNLGVQTMYCSDCHGSATVSTTTNDPDFYQGTSGARRPWGPHGSTNPFILKGLYNVNSISLCTKCHNVTSGQSGFAGSKSNNLHNYHLGVSSWDERNVQIRCNYCHIAVPHGWKHKALLADTNTVGAEVGFASEQAANGSFANGSSFTKGPYYMNAKLRVTNWRRAGNWERDDCNGGVNGMKASCFNK